MIPSDYEYLRKLLKERSGLMLSADKQYLVESRLLPVAHRAGMADLTELVAKLKSAREQPLVTEVAEAMTTNESFFFRDKLPFEHFRRGRCAVRFASGARRPRPGRSPIRWP